MSNFTYEESCHWSGHKSVMIHINPGKVKNNITSIHFDEDCNYGGCNYGKLLGQVIGLTEYKRVCVSDGRYGHNMFVVLLFLRV